jgi:Lon protease-like protein
MSEVSWIPLFPLGVVLLPGNSLPLHIFEERYKSMVGECLEKKEVFGVVYYNGAQITPSGCTAGIVAIRKRYPDGRLDIITRGEKRLATRTQNWLGAGWSFCMSGKSRSDSPDARDSPSMKSRHF